jgi:NADP-dependent 3-hydroxy acid dehydrogenase YdfG
MSDPSAKATALVTGGSRGIGDRLAKRGYNLILMGRSETQRKALSARLTKETGRSVTPLRPTSATKRTLRRWKAFCGIVRPHARQQCRHRLEHGAAEYRG